MAVLKFKNRSNIWEEIPLSGGGTVGSSQKLKYDEICDYYGITSTGEAALATDQNYGCTSYIDCATVTEITLPMVQETTPSGFGLAFYASDKTFLSFVANPVGEELGVVTQTVPVPSGAAYFKTTFFDYERQKTYGLFECTIRYNSEVMSGKNRPYQTGVISFSPIVNQSIVNYSNTNGTESMIPDNYKTTTGNLILPPNYTKDGKPVKLILLSHGWAQYQYYETFGTSQFHDKAAYYASKGFAVFDCNGARNTDRQGEFGSCGMRQFVTAYRQCYEYIVNHYNVDPDIYVVGCSAGGILACNYAKAHGCNVRGLVLIGASTSPKYFVEDWPLTKKNDIWEEYLGIREYDATKFRGLDPNLDKYVIDDTTYFRPYTCPVLVIESTLDNSTLNNRLNEYYDGLVATGTDAQKRVVNNLTHDQMVRDNTPGIDDTVMDWFNMN